MHSTHHQLSRETSMFLSPFLFFSFLTVFSWEDISLYSFWNPCLEVKSLPPSSLLSLFILFRIPKFFFWKMHSLSFLSVIGGDEQRYWQIWKWWQEKCSDSMRFHPLAKTKLSSSFGETWHESASIGSDSCTISVCEGSTNSSFFSFCTRNLDLASVHPHHLHQMQRSMYGIVMPVKMSFWREGEQREDCREQQEKNKRDRHAFSCCIFKSGICILKRIYLFSSSSRGLQTTFPIILSPDSLFLSAYLSLESVSVKSRVKGVPMTGNQEQEEASEETKDTRNSLLYLSPSSWSRIRSETRLKSRGRLTSTLLVITMPSLLSLSPFSCHSFPCFDFRRHRKWKPCCFNTDSHCSSFREKEVWAWF